MNSPAHLLTEWIKSGRLQPQIDDFLDFQRTGTPYKTSKKQGGRVYAELQLSAWADRQQLAAFASAIMPIAQGMLTAASKGGVVYVAHPNDHAFPTFSSAERISPMVVAINTGSGINSSINHELGLQAVTLRVGVGKNKLPMAQLGLMVRPWRLRLDDQSYAAITFGLDGYTRIIIFRPGYNPSVAQALGLSGLVHWTSLGGLTIEGALGYTGAIQHLAKTVSGLGDHLSAMG